MGNKIDRRSEKHESEFAGVENLLFISAKEKTHIDLLKENLASLVLHDEKLGDKTIVTNTRHYDALVKTEEALNDVLRSLESGTSQELFVADIRRALNALLSILLSVVILTSLSPAISKNNL